MNYKILVIDDEQYMHLLIENLLGDEFELIKAADAQQAIDILSTQNVHLILTDIYMPGLDGLELLESLRKDVNKQDIPVLVMTNLPSYEVEQKAANLGAADFIDKTKFNTHKQEVRERIRMKIVSNVPAADIDDDLLTKKSAFVTEVLSKAIKNNFEATASTIVEQANIHFGAEVTAMWILDGESTELLCSSSSLDDFEIPADITDEAGYVKLKQQRTPYLNNNVVGTGKSFFPQSSEAHDLSAEIAVPLFNMDEKKMLLNNFKIHDDADLFGIAVVKRNRLFSTDEFEILSRLITQFGSILWRLHHSEKVH